MLREAYDESYGMNSGENGCGLPIEENYVDNSLYAYWCREYNRFGIGDRWKISIDEYLARPRFKIELLNRLSTELSTAELKPPPTK